MSATMAAMAEQDDPFKVTGRGTSTQNRVQRLMELTRQQEELYDQEQVDKDAFQAVANRVQQLKAAPSRDFTMQRLMELVRLVQKALTQAEAKTQTQNANNPYATSILLDQVRHQLKVLMDSIDPPQGILDSPEFKELMASLEPPAAHKALTPHTSFDRQSLLRGNVRKDILNRQISEAVDRADRLATQKMVSQSSKTDTRNDTPQFAHMTLTQMARELRKRQRKRKKKAQKADELDADLEIQEEPLITQEEAEAFTARALATMQALREEVAPTWAPEQQPWMINQADNEVYNIILAVVPQELFQQTESYQQMQNLRSGEAVFTLRAADRIADAAGRS